MNLFQLIYVNFKRMLKDPMKIGLMFIMPLSVIIFTHFLSSGDTSKPAPSSNLNVAYNIEDKGELGKEFFGTSSKSMWVFINEREKALELLEDNTVAVVYNIPEDFSEKINMYEKPIIQSYKREEGNITVSTEIELNDKLNNLIKNKLLIEKGIIENLEELNVLKTETVLIRNEIAVNNELQMVSAQLIYFIILGASGIIIELLDFKKRNIISRAITTPNSSGTILASVGLSILLFQTIVNIIVLIFGKFIIGYCINGFHIILINIILASMISITLSLVMTRIFNNEGAASLLVTLIGIISLILSILAEGNYYSSVPQFIRNLGKLTPQYWIIDSLTKAKLFPNTFIVLLMIIAIFTAGSYKLKEFSKQ